VSGSTATPPTCARCGRSIADPTVAFMAGSPYHMACVSPPTGGLRGPAELNCGSCLFWRAIVDDDGLGECRARAPIGLPEVRGQTWPSGEVRTWGVKTAWPCTVSSDFCGEFEPTEAA
jgi:hypothetical protein